MPEKQRFFFFIFDQNLAYGWKEGYQTGNNPIATRLFEEFASANSMDVEMRGKMLNQVKEYLTEFWKLYQSSSKLQRLLS